MAKKITRRKSSDNSATYTVTLDIFEMYCLLEACFSGSHLRTLTIERFVDYYYKKMTEADRFRIFTWMHRHFDDREGNYKVREQLCGTDEWLLARFDPNNQYEVTYRGMTINREKKQNDLTVRAFKKGNDGRYYVGVNRLVIPELIVSVKKLEIDLPPNIA